MLEQLTTTQAGQAYSLSFDIGRFSEAGVGVSSASVLVEVLDDLGFWMYAVFGLLVARPLFRLTVGAKIAAVGCGLYGVLYHVLMAGVMARSVATGEIGGYAEALGVLLVVSVLGMAVHLGRSGAAKEA